MKAVQHIAMNCKEIQRQEAFYSKHFGFKRARVFGRDTPKPWIILRLGETCLELFSAPDNALDKQGGEQPIGFKHLAFEVPDLEQAVADLKADGIATGDIIDCNQMAAGLRVCFFNDPEGNILELMEGYTDEEHP